MIGPAWLTPAVLADHVSLTCRVDVHYQGRVIATGLEVLSGTVESSLDRNVMDKVTLRFDGGLRPVSPWDALEKNGQKAHVWVDVSLPNGDVVTVDRGFFQHESWRRVGSEIEVVAYGLLKRLEDDPFPWPTSPAPGATVGDELERLCAPHVTVSAEGPVGRKLPGGLAWGESRTKALQDLLDSLGLFARVENDQWLHVYDPRENRVPVVTYSYDDLLLDVEGEGDERRPNVFTGKGGDDKDKSKRWSHTVSDVDVRSPKSYGIVRELVNVSSAKSQSAVSGATEIAFRNAAVVAAELSLPILPDPRVEVGDIVGLVLVSDVVEGAVDTFSARVTGLVFDLVSDDASPGRLDVEVLRW